MEFSVNHPIIFVLVGIVLLIVLGQSVFFLVRTIKRAKEKGMDMGVIKRTIKKSRSLYDRARRIHTARSNRSFPCARLTASVASPQRYRFAYLRADRRG